jgi:hypothetical protein
VLLPAAGGVRNRQQKIPPHMVAEGSTVAGMLERMAALIVDARRAQHAGDVLSAAAPCARRQRSVCRWAGSLAPSFPGGYPRDDTARSPSISQWAAAWRTVMAARIADLHGCCSDATMIAAAHRGATMIAPARPPDEVTGPIVRPHPPAREATMLATGKHTAPGRFTVIGAIATTAAFGACASGDSRALPAAVVRDSAGITIVESAAAAAARPAGWTLADRPDLVIGVAEGAPEYQLFRVTGSSSTISARVSRCSAPTARSAASSRRPRSSAASSAASTPAAW